MLGILIDRQIGDDPSFGIACDGLFGNRVLSVIIKDGQGEGDTGSGLSRLQHLDVGLCNRRIDNLEYIIQKN